MGALIKNVLITLETLLVWLTTISLNRVDEQYREKLRIYQREAGKALRRAFFPDTTQIAHDMKARYTAMCQWKK